MFLAQEIEKHKNTYCINTSSCDTIRNIKQHENPRQPEWPSGDFFMAGQSSDQSF
jgi:hypothetical protein